MMIVACPKCKTKYRVDESKIGPQGVKLRCVKCKTIFRVSKKPAPTPQVQPSPVPPPPPSAPPSPPPRVSPPAEQVSAPTPAPKPGIPRMEPPKEKLEAISGPYLPKTEPKAELLLADADEVFLNRIGETLLSAGYKVWYARDGVQAFNFIKERQPRVAIIEVMLPGLFGFEVCEKVKADPELKEQVKLVLIGSVYEKDRFRRAPTKLYGADEYVDKYHNGKEVLAKVEKLLGLAEERVAPPSPEAPAPQEVAPPPAEVREPAPPSETPPQAPTPPPVSEEKPTSPPEPAPPEVAGAPRVPPTPPEQPAQPPQAPPTPEVAPPPAPEVAPPPAPEVKPLDWKAIVPDDPAHQKAARLARNIAADIALYNPDLVERGVREGTFWELLAKDIEDGRKHYESKVAPEIRAGTDYLQLALEDLIVRKKKELGLE